MDKYLNSHISLFIDDDEKEELNKLLDSPLIITNELDCHVYDNAVVLPTYNDSWPPKGGVRDKSGNWIENSTAWHYEDKAPFETDDYIDEEVVYIGSLARIYGHTFTDNIAKVWYVLENKPKDLRIAYSAYWKNSAIPQYIIVFFKLLGLDINQFIHITKPTRFKKVFVPDSAFIRHRTKDSIAQTHVKMKELYTLMVNNSKEFCPSDITENYQKVYFSRTRPKGTPNRYNNFRDLNESDLEKAFRKQGYNIIRPEQLSVISQIYILQHCSSFVATEGSISHNSVFVQDGADVVILKKGKWINRYQLALTLLRNNPTTYVDCHHSTPLNNSQYPHEGPFFLECTRHLESYLGVPLKRINRWLRSSWWFYYFLRSRTSIISLFRSRIMNFLILKAK